MAAASPLEEAINAAKNVIFGSAGTVATFCKRFLKNIHLHALCVEEN